MAKETHHKLIKGAPQDECEHAVIKTDDGKTRVGERFYNGVGFRWSTMHDYYCNSEILAHYPLDDIIKAGEEFSCE